RWAAHTSRGSSPVAAARTSASVGPVASAANDCTGLRAATGTPRRRNARASWAVTQVLPTSVPVPATTTVLTGVSASCRRGRPGEDLGERRDELIDLRVGVGRAQRDA